MDLAVGGSFFTLNTQLSPLRHGLPGQAGNLNCSRCTLDFPARPVISTDDFTLNSQLSTLNKSQPLPPLRLFLFDLAERDPLDWLILCRDFGRDG
jgi:hypothetical protein